MKKNIFDNILQIITDHVKTEIFIKWLRYYKILYFEVTVLSYFLV